MRCMQTVSQTAEDRTCLTTTTCDVTEFKEARSLRAVSSVLISVWYNEAAQVEGLGLLCSDFYYQVQVWAA